MGAPPSRIGYTIENAGISVLVTTRALGAGLPAEARQLLWHRFRKVVRLT